MSVIKRSVINWSTATGCIRRVQEFLHLRITLHWIKIGYSLPIFTKYINWHGLESTFYSTCLITKCICNRRQFFINLYKNQENVYCRGYKARWKQRNALNFWAINFVLFKQFVSLSLNYVSSLFFCVSLYSLSLLYSKCAKTEFCNLRRCFILFLVLTSTSNPTWICWQEDIKPWMKFKHINLYFTFLFLTRNVKFIFFSFNYISWN